MHAWPPLIEYIATLPDPRQARGKRQPLGAMVALAVAATLCGYRSYSAIAEWGRTYGAEISRALGFTREQTPCAATFYDVFRQLDRAALEACLGRWVQQVLAELPATDPPTVPGVALDGKALRGSRTQGAPLTPLLSAVSHRLGLTLGQVAIAEKTNEITAIHTLLTGLLLEGQVVTLDALLTQQKIAAAIVAAKADYIMIVKQNQPELYDDIATAFADPELLAASHTCTARTLDKGHGRLERRTLTMSTALTDYAAFVLERVRAHWIIENGSHYVRDVTFTEDQSQVRTGSIPQVMAAVRNTAIARLRVAGETNIARACRRLTAHPWQALALLGLPTPTIE